MSLPLPMPLQMALVPNKITDRLTDIAKLHLGEDAKPRFVDVVPLEFCLAQNCHHDVQQSVHLFGGNQQIGWAVNHVPGEYFEFVAHSVWERPNESWVDVTPEPGPKRRVFVPDSSVQYDGMQPIATRFFADGANDASIRTIDRMNSLAERAIACPVSANDHCSTEAHSELSQLVAACIQRSAMRGWTS